MFEKLYPTESASSTYAIDFKSLYEQGFRGIIFDIDNTLVCHGKPADDRCTRKITELTGMGYKVLFLSNNKEPRVKSFSDSLPGTMYIYKAGKPSVKGYEKAMEMMETDTVDTLFVGDQIFTDIWGANKAGIYSILVGRIGFHEEIQIHLKRIIEQPVLWAYRHKLKKAAKVDSSSADRYTPLTKT